MAQTKSQTPILRDQIIEALRGIKLRQGQALRTVDVPPHVYEGAKEFVKTIPPDEAIFRTYHMYDILNPGETQLLEAEAKIAEWQSGCKALLRYALNLLLAPKRPEFRRLKLSNSYYMYQVAKKLQHAEEVLMAMGYKRTGSSQEVQELSYEGEVNIATLHEAATDLVFLYSELELLKEVVQQILSNPEYQRLPARVTLQTLLDARKRDIPFRYDMMWAHLMRLVYQQQAKQSRHEESQQAPSTQASHVSSGQASSSQAHLEVRNNRQDLRRGSAPAVSGFRGGEQDRFFSLQDPSAEQTQLPGGRGDQSYGYQQHGASGAFLHGQQQQQRGYPYYPTHEGKHARVVGDGENHEAVHRRQKHKEVSSDSPQMTHLSEQKPTASSSLYQNAPGMQPATANSQHYQNAPGMQPATANSQLYQNAPGMQPATANSQLYQNAPGIQPATARSQHYRNLLMQSGVAIPASTVGSTINSSSSNGIYQNLPSANTTNTPSSSNSEVANTGRDPNLQSIETRLRGIFQQYPDLVGNKSAGQGDDYPVNSPQQSESSFDPSDLPPPMVESTQQLQNLFSPDEGIVSGLINVRSVQDDGAGGPDLFMSFGSPPTQLQGLRFDNDYEKQLPPLIQLQDSTHTAQESEGEPSIRETLAPSSHQPYKTTTGEMPSIHSSDPIPSTAPPTSGVAVPGYTQPSRKKPQQKSQTFDVLEEEHPSPQLKRHHSHQPYTTTTGETPPIHSSEPNPTFAPPTTSGVAVPGYTQPSRKKPQQKSQTFDVLEEEHLSPQLKRHHSHQPYTTTTGETPPIHSSEPNPTFAPPTTSGVAVPGYTQPSRKKPQQKSQTFDVLEEEHLSPQLKRHHSHQPYTTTTGETPPIHSSEPNPTFAPPTTSGVAVPGYTQPSRKKPQQKAKSFDVLEEERPSPQLKHHHSASRLDRMEMPPSQVPSSGATEKVKHFDKHLLKVDGDYGVSQNQMRPRVSATSSKSRDNSEKLTIDDLNQGIANSQKPVPMPRNQSKPPLKPVSKDLAPADNIPGIKNMLVPPLHHVKPQDYSSTKTVGDAGVSENRGRPEHLQLGEHSYRRAIHGDPQRELPRGHSDGQFQHRPEIPRPKVVRQWAMEKSPSTTDKSKAMANTRDTASVDTSKGSIVPVWPKEAESSLDHKGRARIPSLLEKQNLGNVNASSSTTNPNSLTERELSLLSSQGTPATTETGEFTDFWVCKYCTNVVDKDLHICDVCGNVRVD